MLNMRENIAELFQTKRSIHLSNTCISQPLQRIQITSHITTYWVKHSSTLNLTQLILLQFKRFLSSPRHCAPPLTVWQPQSTAAFSRLFLAALLSVRFTASCGFFLAFWRSARFWRYFPSGIRKLNENRLVWAKGKRLLSPFSYRIPFLVFKIFVNW